MKIGSTHKYKIFGQVKYYQTPQFRRGKFSTLLFLRRLLPVVTCPKGVAKNWKNTPAAVKKVIQLASGSLKMFNSPSRIFCNNVGFGIAVVVVVAGVAVVAAVVVGVVEKICSYCNVFGEEVV